MHRTVKRIERALQQTLVAHVRNFYPDLLFWHTPNGEDRPGGPCVILQSMGTKPGVPDLFFPTLRLFIEMKAPYGVLSPAQKQVIAVLELDGYDVRVYDSWRKAFAYIEERMRGRTAFGFLTGNAAV